MALVAVAVACCTPAQRPDRQPNEALYLGVVHQDGLLIPSAIYDGHEWWNRWPFAHESDESISALTIPDSLSSIPAAWLPPGIRMPVSWRVQLADGTVRQIRLVRPERPDRPFLAAFVGICTDQQPIDGETSFGGEPERGVAISGPGRLGRFATAATMDANRMFTAVLPALNDAETLAIQERLDLDWKDREYTFPARPDERADRPFVYTSWLRDEGSRDGRSFYYFTGQREYGDRPFPDCAVTVDFHAVVVERDGRIDAPMVGAYTTFECTRDNAIRIVHEPLASLHWAGPVLWLVKLRAEDGYEYGLINPAPSGDIGSPEPKCLWVYRDQCAQP